MRKRYFFVIFLFSILLFGFFQSLSVEAVLKQNHYISEGITLHTSYMDEEDLKKCDQWQKGIDEDDFVISQENQNGIAPFSLGESTADTGLLGDSLTGYSRELYDCISQADLNAFANTLELWIDLDHRYADGETGEALAIAFKGVYMKSMIACLRDYHDQFLWATNTFGYGKEIFEDHIVVYLVYYKSPYCDINIENAINRQINTVVAQCKETTREDKLRYYHDWLLTNCQYDKRDIALADKDAGSSIFYYAHSAAGALIGGRGVCESYAKAFKLFCMKENIPCLIVSSTTHAWNYVKMEDDRWYMIDCTFDDTSDSTSTSDRYFLISNQPNDSKHECDNKYTYPTTSATKYQREHHFKIANKVEPTCLHKGLIEYICIDSGCGEEKSVEYAVNPNNHGDNQTIYSQFIGNCKDRANTIFSCSACGKTMTEYGDINPKNHEGLGTIIIDQKEATCVSEGYTGDTYCKYCNKLIQEGRMIYPTGIHTWELTTQDEATCIHGMVFHYSCRVCATTKEEEAEEKNPKNHVGEKEDIMVLQEGTCVSAGLQSYVCSICKQVEEEELPKDSNNHVGGHVLKNDKKETCGQDGYSGNIHCQGCDKKLEDGQIIEATGQHTWGEVVIIKPADCSHVAQIEKTCSVCQTVMKEDGVEFDSSHHTGAKELRDTIEATTNAQGYSGNTYCADCGVLLKKGLVIAKIVPGIVNSLTLSNVANGIKLSWKPVANARGYCIYRKYGKGSYVLIQKVANPKLNAYTDAGVKGKNGQLYTYAVRSYYDDKMGGFVEKSLVRLNAVTISKVSNPSKKKMKIVWKKQTKATGYQIQYSMNSKFEKGNKTVNINKMKTTSRNVGGLTKKKTYYVRIRAYKTVGKAKYYSDWSKVKRITIKR